MPFSLIPDGWWRDARWMALAEIRGGRTERARRRDAKLIRDAAIGMMCETAAGLNDGYLTRSQALDCCEGDPWILDLLTRPVLGKQPYLHQPGQKCPERNCIDASPPWVDGFTFRICHYLKRNPSAKEKARNDAQRRDLDSATLRAFLFDRDGACCRYCRSGPLKRKGTGRVKDRRRIAVVEHVDPDFDALPDRSNAVLGCAACNEYKGRRTPDEACMVLLPVPTPEQAAYWSGRGEQQFDRPEPGQPHPADTVPDNARDKPPDNAETTSQTTSQTTSPGVVTSVVHGAVQSVVATPVLVGVSPGGAQDNGHDNAGEGSGSGRVGQPHTGLVVGQGGQPIRSPDAPDIYHRRSRSPDPARAGPPLPQHQQASSSEKGERS